jgi:glycerophosphoryl diester phosphodiesterase
MKTLIIAHRGESYDAPENTMAAIDLAWERDAEAVEIDVQHSKDGEVVVIHDLNTKRLAGIYKNVKDQTLEELRSLDVGTWKSAKFMGEKIPVIEEVLQSLPAGKKLIIEIKSGVKTIPILKQKLECANLELNQIEIIGFDLETMIAAREAFLEHKVLWLLDLDYTWQSKLFGPSIKNGIALAKKHKFEGLNVWAGKMLDKSMIDQIHDAGLLAYCWTLDDLEKAKKLLDWGIDAITTNRAHWIKRHLFF